MNMMKGGIMYEQKEVVLIPFPYSDLMGSKKRPALIISNERINKTEDRICCLVTSQPTKEGILINKLEEGKLPFKSWIKIHRLFTISEKIIIKKLCKINNNLFSDVIKELNANTKRI